VVQHRQGATAIALSGGDPPRVVEVGPCVRQDVGVPQPIDLVGGDQAETPLLLLLLLLLLPLGMVG